MEPVSDITTVLSGCNVFVEVRTDMEDISRSIAKNLLSLGAEISPTLKIGVTHIIYRFGTKKTRDWAEKRGVPLVTVAWISACREYKTRMPEGFYRVKHESTSPINPLEPWKKKKRPRRRFMQPLSTQEEERRSAQKEKRKQRQAKINALKQNVIDAENVIKRHEEIEEYLTNGGELPSETVKDFYHLYLAKAKIYVPPTPPAMIAFRERQERKARGEKVDSLSSSDESDTETPSKITTTPSNNFDSTTNLSSTRPSTSSALVTSELNPSPTNMPSTSRIYNSIDSFNHQEQKQPSSCESSNEISYLSSTPDHYPSNHHLTENLNSPSPKFNKSQDPPYFSNNVTSRKKIIQPETPSQKVTLSPVVYVCDSEEDCATTNNLNNANYSSVTGSHSNYHVNNNSVTDLDESMNSNDDLVGFFHPSPVYPSQIDANTNRNSGSLPQSTDSNTTPIRNSSEALRHNPIFPNESPLFDPSPVIPRSGSPLFAPATEDRVNSPLDYLWSQISEATNDQCEPASSNFTHSQKRIQNSANNSPLSLKKNVKLKSAKIRRYLDDRFEPRRKKLHNAEEDEPEPEGDIEVFSLPYSLIRRKPSVPTTHKPSSSQPSKKTTSQSDDCNDKPSTVTRATNTDFKIPNKHPADKNACRSTEPTKKAPRDSIDEFWLEKTFTMDRLHRLKARKMKSKVKNLDSASSSKSGVPSSNVTSLIRHPHPTNSMKSLTGTGNHSIKKNFVIAITSLHSKEKTEVKSAITALPGTQLVDCVNRYVTHLIGNAGSIRRTINLLLALVVTEPPCEIVTIDWLRESVKRKKWVDEAPYRVVDCLTKEEMLLSRRLFVDYDYFYIAENVNPPRSELTKIIEGCGGKVIKSFRQAGILIGAERPNAISVNPKWIFDSLMATIVLPIEEYLPNK